MAALAAILIDRKRDDKFKSDTPKLLHACAGLPLWRWTLSAVQSAGAEKVVWLGDSASLAALKAEQPVARTFEEALRLLGPASGYLVAYADAALLHPDDLAALVEEGMDAAAPRWPDLEEDGLEAAFAFVPAAARKALSGTPAKGLLPGKAAKAQTGADPFEASLRVLDRRDLSDAEGWLRDRIIHAHQVEGVTFVDPSTCFVDAQVQIGRDSVVQPYCFLSGATVIGKRAQVGPFTRAHDSRLDDGCAVVQSTLEGAHVRAGAQVGPWSRLRPGSDIGEGAHTGSFVEVKNSSLGPGAKAGHLAYLGDTQVGKGANIGAGTITANYDGKAKHPTRIGDRAFIGSGTVLVAPVSIGEGAVTGAGSVVLKGRDVPKGATVAGVPARLIQPKKAQSRPR